MIIIIHLNGAPTTVISVTTVPNVAPAFTIGVAARHLMVLVALLTFLSVSRPPEGSNQRTGPRGTEPGAAVAPTARELRLVTSLAR